LKIGKNSVVRFEYTLKNDKGEVLDSSQGAEPLAYLHGQGQIVPGLEEAMAGKAAGDKFDVKVAPGEGYGDRDEQAVFQVPRAKLPKGVDPKVGMELGTRTPDGELMRLKIVKIEGDTVTVDANHPLAGENLNFNISIVEVRDATKEELDHGHAHGPEGHEHGHEGHEHGPGCQHGHDEHHH
jgi:FKBP-type peptidyl-prolyl cis-trans isomerase SlyD